MTPNCPSCGSRGGGVFYRIEGAPVNSGRPLSSRARAVAAPRGDIVLTFCGACGLVFNAAFDPALIPHGGRRDEPCTFASHTAFRERLAAHLSERYALIGKDILAIGGGNDLMALLREGGDNHCVQVDLGRAPDPRHARSRAAAPLSQWPTVDATLPGPADLVCCTRCLERSADPASLLGWLRRVVGRRAGARLFLQVANLLRTLNNFAFWEIHYDQRSYFSPGTLHRLLRAQGFQVDDVWTDFDAQYLMADTRAATEDEIAAGAGQGLESIADLAALVARFEHECREKQAMWCEILSKLAAAGNRIAIWGAGAGAASFLTTLAVGSEISYVVDVRASRQGQYTPGTGHRIVGPEAMATMRPDVVIVMNSALTFEIRDSLARAGCAPTLLIA